MIVNSTHSKLQLSFNHNTADITNSFVHKHKYNGVSYSTN